MILELPKLEDLSKDEVLEEALVAAYPIHPFYILDQRSVTCLFEPLLSVQKMSVIGLEAVRRAVDPDDPSRLFEPEDLFRSMTVADSHLRLPLERLFLQNSLETFFPLQSQAPHLLMFMDAEPSVLEESLEEPGHWFRQAAEWSLDPRRIVVQIALTGQADFQSIWKFAESQRGYGFLVSLKDVTSSPQHLDILLRLNPDMVKVKESLVRGLANSKEKQAIFMNILKRAHSLGILVVASGIESEEDALVALEFGTDLVQGRYFSKNYKKNTIFMLNRKSRMQFLASRFKRRMTGKANKDRGLKNRCALVAEALAACLPNKPVEDWEAELPSLFPHFQSLECLYLLNAEGIQVTETLCSQYHIPERKGILFHPSPKGSDHSLREIYYALLSTPTQHRYLTDPYLSMNSGHLCVTVAMVVGDPTGDFYILCADLNAAKV